MDEDVRLSMKQAHQKWIVKAILLGGTIVLGAITWWVHEFRVRECSDAVLSPYATYNGVLKCPDPRQTLSFPPGWTYAKCTCPKVSDVGKE